MQRNFNSQQIGNFPAFQFPIELVERAVLAFTDEDDWVIDPFGWVGSSLVAALKHNRGG